MECKLVGLEAPGATKSLHSFGEVFQALGLPGQASGKACPCRPNPSLCGWHPWSASLLMGVVLAAGASVQADGQEAHHS